MAGEKGRKSTIVKIIVIVFVLLIGAAVLIPLVVDVNRFRPEIESRLSKALGREVSVGEMKLSLFSGGIMVADIEIADNPAFSKTPFLTAKSLSVAIEMRPLLFSRELLINGIAIDRPEIALLRAPSGAWNFSDLGRQGRNSASAVEGPAPGNPGGGMVVRQLKITDGKITVVDGGKRPSVYENVAVEISNLSFDTSFPFSLSATLPGGGTLKLGGEAGPLNQDDTYRTPMAADLEVRRFDLVGAGVVSSDAGLSGLFDLSGATSSDGRTFQSRGQATASNLQVVSGGAPAGKPVALEYLVDYDLSGRRGTVRDVSVGYGKAIARLNGTIATQGEKMVLSLRLRGDDMPVDDLAELLPAFGVTLPKGSSLQGGVFNTDLTVEGPLEKLVTAGTVAVSNTNLVGFDLSGRIADVAMFAGLQPGNQTRIETFSSGIRLTPEGTRVDNLMLIVPALGTLSGAGVISPEQTLDFTMQAALKPDGVLGAGMARLVRGGSLTIPFFVRGTASDPQFVPDAGKAAGSILESILGDRGKKEEQSDLEESLGDALRELFKRNQ